MASLIHKTGVILLLISLNTPISLSQERRDSLNVLNRIKYTEELFVQTDRDIYIVGENVFLKIFKLNGVTRTPGNISKVVYVELLDLKR